MNKLRALIFLTVILMSSLWAGQSNSIVFKGINVGDEWEDVLDDLMIMKYEIGEQHQREGLLTISDYRFGNEIVVVDFIFSNNKLQYYSINTDNKAKFAETQRIAREFSEILSRKLGNPEKIISPRKEEVRLNGKVLYRKWEYGSSMIILFLEWQNSTYRTVIRVK